MIEGIKWGETDERPRIVSELYHRWQRRIFANDDISCQPSDEGEGYWELGIIRGNKRALLTVAPNAYQNPRFMLDADETMRYALKSMRR